MREECGAVVEPEDFRKVGTIDFEFVGDPVLWEVHVFLTDKYSGEPIIQLSRKPSSRNYLHFRVSTERNINFLHNYCNINIIRINDININWLTCSKQTQNIVYTRLYTTSYLIVLCFSF